MVADGVSIQGTDKVFPVKDNKSEILIELVSAPTSGSLMITSEPKGALVHLDGIEKGQTPFHISQPVDIKTDTGSRCERVKGRKPFHRTLSHGVNGWYYR